MTKAFIPTEYSKKQMDNTKNANKTFNKTKIADRLRTVTGVVKPVYVIPTLQLTAKAL